MSVSEKVATTVIWAKQLTTGTYSTLTKPLLENEFARRNMKAIGLSIFLWALVICSAYWYTGNAASTHKRQFLDRGIQELSVISEKINTPLLENDLLTLNIAITELGKKIDPVFAAILNHDGTVMVHTDQDAVGKPLEGLPEATVIENREGALIESGRFRGFEPVVQFSRLLEYAKVTIGQVVFGLRAADFQQPADRYRTIFWVLSAVATLLLAGTIMAADILKKRKTARELDAFERLNKVGPYMLKRKIAQGGMAELYLAEYVREDGFRRTVALKKILPHFAQNKDFIDMFIREARLAAMLQHPNIVQIFDLIRMHNSSFMAMEYIHGKNLAEIMVQEKKGLPVGLALFIIQKITSGLYYSHSRVDDTTGEPLSIVHRDISPQNILISFKGEVKISDFGISKAKSEPSLTQAGVIKGKLSYLSPEQALGREVDHQADIYALGLIFHELLTGKRVYRFENELDAIRTIPTMTIAPVTDLRPDAPEELNPIVQKCLKKDKALRYQTCRELHDDIVELKTRLHITIGGSHLGDFMQQLFGEKE